MLAGPFSAFTPFLLLYESPLGSEVELSPCMTLLTPQYLQGHCLQMQSPSFRPARSRFVGCVSAGSGTYEMATSLLDAAGIPCSMACKRKPRCSLKPFTTQLPLTLEAVPWLAGSLSQEYSFCSSLPPSPSGSSCLSPAVQQPQGAFLSRFPPYHRPGLWGEVLLLN